MARKRIVILGGGFGGVYTSMNLEKQLRPDEAEIFLVNRENYFVYQPMLPEVICGSIGLTDTVVPIRSLCPRTRLVMREVEAISLRDRLVTVSPGFQPHPMNIRYDYLVIALGNVTNLVGLPGMEEHVLPFRTLADALILRNRTIHAMEEADIEPDPAFRRKLLTFVVAGGGFSGVEVIAELNDFVIDIARHYRNITVSEIRCVLVHSGNRILPEMVESLGLFAQKLLVKRGVEIKLNDRLIAATSEKAILKSGMEIPSKTIVSTVPSALPPLLMDLDCCMDRDRLQVNGFLELKDYEGQVWALGDCASIRTQSGNLVPPTAQHAVQEAKTVASNISGAIRGEWPKLFTYEDLGRLGSLGHHSAVAEILNISVSGFAAWVLWRLIYLMKMPGLNRKFRVAADWFTALLLPPDLVQLKIGNPPGITEQHLESGDIVFNQGDVGNCVYVIQSGQCEVLREDAGLQKSVAVLGPGEYFGEMAVLSEASRNATIRALSQLDLLVISKQDFQMLKSNIPAFAKVFEDLARQRSASNPARSPQSQKSP
ncbi:MAG TPA: FAD-dependent oxidoreductase [Acidobacteriota bacterium]